MIYEKKFRVNISDVDKDNKIRISSIIKYLQEIATLHSDSAKDGINYLDENKAIWIILNWKIRVYKSLKWNDVCTIKTWSRKTEKIYSYRDYEVLNENGERVAIATSKWLYFDYATNSIKIPPVELIKRYEPEDIPVFDTQISKLREPEEKEFKYSYEIQKRDIDCNNHVNNANYFDFAENVLPENIEIKDIEILYKKECKLGEHINIFYNETENIVVIKNKETSAVHAIVKLNGFFRDAS